MSVATAPSFPFLPTREQVKASKATASVKSAPKKRASTPKVVPNSVAMQAKELAKREPRTIVPTACKSCGGAMKPFRDKAKGETETTPTCQDCGWRKGDKVKAKGKASTPKVVKTTTKGKGVKAAPAMDKKKVVASAAVHAAKAIKTPRKGFTLSEDDLEQYRTTWKESKGKVIPIPHNRGAYRAFIAALIQLGVNRPHSFKAVKDLIRAEMSLADTRDDEGKTAWQRYIGKEAKSDENALKVDGKLHQNAEVLQRLGGETPYGLRLLQVGKMVMKSKGMVVDILKAKDESTLYRLNTNSAEPVNEFRRQRSK